MFINTTLILVLLCSYLSHSWTIFYDSMDNAVATGWTFTKKYNGGYYTAPTNDAKCPKGGFCTFLRGYEMKKTFNIENLAPLSISYNFRTNGGEVLYKYNNQGSWVKLFDDDIPGCDALYTGSHSLANPVGATTVTVILRSPTATCGTCCAKVWADNFRLSSTAPTMDPSKDPTRIPTTSPTPAPTTNPTLFPTSSPSQPPTSAPTMFPTIDPTSSPSQPPTSAPTTFPTVDPTPYPSQPPTLAPTSSPSLFPSNSPTAATPSPTTSPSFSPSSNPSLAPTLSPSNAPSKIPTNAPSFSPTRNPSLVPTEPPTNTPSISPTNNPTNVPTLAPTMSPTYINDFEYGICLDLNMVSVLLYDIP
eukprot:383828_1